MFNKVPYRITRSLGLFANAVSNIVSTVEEASITA